MRKTSGIISAAKPGIDCEVFCQGSYEVAWIPVVAHCEASPLVRLKHTTLLLGSTSRLNNHIPVSNSRRSYQNLVRCSISHHTSLCHHWLPTSHFLSGPRPNHTTANSYYYYLKMYSERTRLAGGDLKLGMLYFVYFIPTRKKSVSDPILPLSTGFL